MMTDTRGTNYSLIERMLIWPVQRPWWTLGAGLVIGVLAVVSFSRITPATSLTPMFARDDPSVQAMLKLITEFRIADNLIILVQHPEPSLDGQTGANDRNNQRLIHYAQRLKEEIATNPQARSMTNGVVYQQGKHARKFIRNELVPAGIYYLDDAQFQSLQHRLQPRQMRQQIQRNEALLSAASPSTDMLSERILKDPLRLHALLLRSLGYMEAEADSSQQANDGADNRSQASGQPEARGAARGGFAGGFASGGAQAPPVLSEDGQSLLIRVHGDQPAGELDFTKRFMPLMRRMVAQAKPGDLRVSYTGAYPIAELSARVIRSDMIRSVVVSIIILHILFLVAYRWAWSFPLTFVPVGAGIITGFGIFGLLSPRLTPVTAASGAILAGLGVDYCIHYLTHYMSERGSDAPSATIQRTSLRLGPALLAACVTSLIGFLSVGASSVPALQDFAMIGSLGLGCILVATMTLLPAALRLIDRPGPPTGAPASTTSPRSHRPPLRFRIDPLVGWIGRHRGACFGLSLTVIAASVLVLAIKGPVGLNSDPSVLHPRPSKPMQTREEVSELFPSATEAIPIHLQAPSSEALVITAHEARRRLLRTEAARSGLIRSFGLGTLLPDPAVVKKRRPAVRAIDSEQVVANFQAAVKDSKFDPAVYEDYAKFLRTLLDDPQPPTMATVLDYPDLAETLLPRSAFSHPEQPVTQALTLVNLRRGFDDAQLQAGMLRSMRDAMMPVPGATVTGDELVRIDLEQTIRRDLEKLLIIAAILVTLWLFIMFHRPRRVLLTLLPTVVCMLVVFAVMRLTGQKLNILNLIALPMLAGIGVDDGIFLVSLAKRKADRHRSADDNQGESLIEQLASSCHAITMTSLTTALAFGSLMLTRTPAIRSLGLVLGLGMIGCWFATVFLLGPILIGLDKRAGAKRPSDVGSVSS